MDTWMKATKIPYIQVSEKDRSCEMRILFAKRNHSTMPIDKPFDGKSNDMNFDMRYNTITLTCGVIK